MKKILTILTILVLSTSIVLAKQIGKQATKHTVLAKVYLEYEKDCIVVIGSEKFMFYIDSSIDKNNDKYILVTFNNNNEIIEAKDFNRRNTQEFIKQCNNTYNSFACISE